MVCKTFTQEKNIILRILVVFLQKHSFLYLFLPCIQKLHKLFPVITFAGGIKNFVTQDNTYQKWILSRTGQVEYVAVLKEVTGMDKSSQDS